MPATSRLLPRWTSPFRSLRRELTEIGLRGQYMQGWTAVRDQLVHQPWPMDPPNGAHAVDITPHAFVAGAAAVAIGGVLVISLVHLGPMSTHMVHHIALMNVLAPPSAIVLLLLAQARIRAGRGALMWTASSLQIALLWAWHAPPLHAAAASGAIYAAMLASLFVAALCFWGGILLLPSRSAWQAIVALLATGKLSCLLGALLIFAPRLLYPHAASHSLAHSLQDQQLAGLLMVVACPLSYVLVGVILSSQLVYPPGTQAELRGGPD